MKKTLAALALMISAATSQAALVSVPLWDSNQPGLAGLQFKTASKNGVEIALTAFDFTNNTTLSNNGSVFQASLGSSGPDSLAKWGFGYLINTTNYCLSCLRVDMVWDYDPGAGTDMRGYMGSLLGAVVTSSYRNLEWDAIEADFGAWNPDQPGLYDLLLRVVDTDDMDNAMVEVRIQVQLGDPLAVPAPGSLPLAGVALGALAWSRRSARRQPALPA